jgi:hypothetical protein
LVSGDIEAPAHEHAKDSSPDVADTSGQLTSLVNDTIQDPAHNDFIAPVLVRTAAGDETKVPMQDDTTGDQAKLTDSEIPDSLDDGEESKVASMLADDESKGADSQQSVSEASGTDADSETSYQVAQEAKHQGDIDLRDVPARVEAEPDCPGQPTTASEALLVKSEKLTSYSPVGLSMGLIMVLLSVVVYRTLRR